MRSSALPRPRKAEHMLPLCVCGLPPQAKILVGLPHFLADLGAVRVLPDKSETVSLFSFSAFGLLSDFRTWNSGLGSTDFDSLALAHQNRRCYAPAVPITRLSHINITMPKGSEEVARSFYGKLLGLREIPKPEPLRVRGGVWFDAGGLDVHVSVEENRFGPDAYRHFGLECSDVAAIRRRLETAGIATEDGRPAPWKRFFVHDPFGNRIEIHEVGGLRA